MDDPTKTSAQRTPSEPPAPPPPAPPPPAPPPPARPPGPTRQQREAKIRQLQAEALQENDSLAANLGLLNGDLLLLGQRLGQCMEETVPVSAGGGIAALAGPVELYLKVARQIERLSRVQRELARDRNADET